MTMTTLIQNEQKRQKIMARMREHLVPVLEHCRGGWVGHLPGKVLRIITLTMRVAILTPRQSCCPAFPISC